MGRFVPDEVRVTHEVNIDINEDAVDHIVDHTLIVIGVSFLCATVYKLITRTSDKETYVVLP